MGPTLWPGGLSAITGMDSGSDYLIRSFGLEVLFASHLEKSGVIIGVAK
jgi:hypothetical protein